MHEQSWESEADIVYSMLKRSLGRDNFSCSAGGYDDCDYGGCGFLKRMSSNWSSNSN